MGVSMHTIRMLLLASVGLAAVGWLPVPARAADATPEQASRYEAELRDTIGKLLGPSIKIPDRPVQMTASGDHYDVAMPVPLEKMLSLGAVSQGAKTPSSSAQMTGRASLGDNGIWTVQNLAITSPVTFSVMMPVPPSDDKAAPKITPVTFTMDQKGQDGRIVWDPSFQTPSSWTSSTQSTTVHAKGGPIEQNTTVGPTNATTTLRPSGADRLDMVLDGSLQDYDIDNGGPMPVSVAMKQLRVASALNGVSRENGTKLIQAMAALIAANPSKTSPTLAPLVKAILAALDDFATDFMLDETVGGLAVQVMGQNVTVDQFRLGLDARSDAGMLRSGITFGMAGIALPDFPLGPFADLVPQRIEIHPVVGGAAAHDVLHMASLAVDDTDPSQADINALFSHGGVTGGIDSMVVEVGGATFTGQGKVVATAPAPQAVTGIFQLTADNFDTLMGKVTAIPSLAQQAVPALVFIKGIGRTVDNKLVWDITYKDGKMLCNNVDLTAMAGIGAAPRQTTPAPNRNTPGGALKQPTRPPGQGQVPSWGK